VLVASNFTQALEHIGQLAQPIILAAEQSRAAGAPS
jgi:hypothetical protein